MRGATAWAFGSAIVPAFQPTRPLRGATPSIEIRLTDSEISTHAPLAGRDSLRSTLAKSDVNFNPRAPCGARPFYGRRRFLIYNISTHAPLAGRDQMLIDEFDPESHFNPRAPCGARRLFCFVSCRLGSYFNPRAPCGARPALLLFVALGIYISTHAPLAGRDKNSPDPLRGHGEFQPTRPLRGATFGAVLHLAWHIIFQPTRPLRGATCDIQPCSGGHPISTHAPLAGRDCRISNRIRQRINFNPRAPCGARRLLLLVSFFAVFDFNPRAPCGARH